MNSEEDNNGHNNPLLIIPGKLDEIIL